MSLAFIQPGNTQILRPKSGFALAAQVLRMKVFKGLSMEKTIHLGLLP
jgi:hypothetical protein